MSANPPNDVATWHDLLSCYRRPFLAVDSIAADSRSVVLKRAHEEVELEVRGDSREVLTVLRRMQDPRWQGWKRPAQFLSLGDGLTDLIRVLRDVGWIRDAETSAARHLDSRGTDLRRALARGIAWRKRAQRTCASAGGDAAERFDRVIERLQQEARGNRQRSARRECRFHRMPHPYSNELHENVAHLQLAAWRRTAPELLPLVRAMLAGDEHRLTRKDLHAAGVRGPSLRDVENALCTLGALAFLSACAPTPIALGNVRRVDSRLGLNVLLNAEAAVRAWLQQVQPTPMFTRLAAKANAKHLAAQVFASQLFITEHYVEAIFPLLRRKVEPATRAQLYRYFDEEYGHERMERAACLAAGVSPKQIEAFCPLPLMAAYTDCFGMIAECDLLAFACSLLATEGMPGTRKPLSRILAKNGVAARSFTAHVAVDEKLDHAQKSRAIASGLYCESTEHARIAVGAAMFMAQLAAHAWISVGKFSCMKGMPKTPQAFELSPKDLLGCASRI